MTKEHSGKQLTIKDIFGGARTMSEKYLQAVGLHEIYIHGNQDVLTKVNINNNHETEPFIFRFSGLMGGPPYENLVSKKKCFWKFKDNDTAFIKTHDVLTTPFQSILTENRIIKYWRTMGDRYLLWNSSASNPHLIWNYNCMKRYKDFNISQFSIFRTENLELFYQKKIYDMVNKSVDQHQNMKSSPVSKINSMERSPSIYSQFQPTPTPVKSSPSPSPNTKPSSGKKKKKKKCKKSKKKTTPKPKKKWNPANDGLNINNIKQWKKKRDQIKYFIQNCLSHKVYNQIIDVEFIKLQQSKKSITKKMKQQLFSIESTKSISNKNPENKG